MASLNANSQPRDNHSVGAQPSASTANSSPLPPSETEQLGRSTSNTEPDQSASNIDQQNQSTLKTEQPDQSTSQTEQPGQSKAQIDQPAQPASNTEHADQSTFTSKTEQQGRSASKSKAREFKDKPRTIRLITSADEFAALSQYSERKPATQVVESISFATALREPGGSETHVNADPVLPVPCNDQQDGQIDASTPAGEGDSAQNDTAVKPSDKGKKKRENRNQNQDQDRQLTPSFSHSYSLGDLGFRPEKVVKGHLEVERSMIPNRNSDEREDQEPRQQIVLFARDKILKHEKIEKSFWQQAINTDWRMHIRNSIDGPSKKSKKGKKKEQPNLNPGFVRVEGGAFPADRVQILVDRYGKPSGYRITVPEVVSEESEPKPKAFMKHTLPWDKRMTGYEYLSTLTNEQRQDPEFMNDVARQLADTLQEAARNYRLQAWKTQKIQERMEHNELQYREESSQNAILHRKIAELEAELSNEKRITAMYREKDDSMLKELSNSSKEHSSISKDIRKLLEHNKKTSPNLADQLSKLQDTSAKQHEVLERMFDGSMRIMNQRLKFGKDIQEIERDVEMSIKTTFLDAAHATGDANIARASYRNGLNAGRQLGRRDFTTRIAATEASDMTRRDVMEHLNEEWARIYDNGIQKAVESTKFLAKREGILAGVNMAHALQTGDFDDPSMSKEHILEEARIVGEMARRYFKAGTLQDHMPNAVQPGHRDSILHPVHGERGHIQDPESFHGQALKSFGKKRNAFEFPEPAPPPPWVYIGTPFNADEIESVIDKMSNETYQAFAEAELEDSELLSYDFDVNTNIKRGRIRFQPTDTGPLFLQYL